MFLIYMFNLSYLTVCTSDVLDTQNKIPLHVLVNTINEMKRTLERTEAEHRKQFDRQSRELLKLRGEVSDLRNTLGKVAGMNTSPSEGYDNSPVGPPILQDLQSEDLQIKYGPDSSVMEKRQPEMEVSGIRSHIAFYARLSQPLSYVSDGENIAFEDVITNEGAGYNGTSGVFTCPVDGMYVFSVTIVTMEHYRLKCSLVKNGRMVGRVYGGADALHSSDSVTMVLPLNVGDRVSLRVYGVYHETGNILSAIFSSFSGFLLYDM